MPIITSPELKALNRLVGTWTTEATHPAVPGVIVHGTAVMEWLEGERFLIQRARNDHPDFPDAISIIGFIERDRVETAPRIEPATVAERQFRMHYFDSRGVFRVYEISTDDESWRLWRNAPGFSQRFTGMFADRGATIVGRWQLCRDQLHWNDDLEITYQRRG